MRELLFVFQDVEDPRRGNAKRHDLHEMLVLALLAMLYFLLSGKPSAERFGRIVRSQWTIENGLHWVLDVSMDED